MSVRHLVLNRPDILPGRAEDVQSLPEADEWYDYRLKNTIPRVFTQDRIVLCTEDEAREEMMKGDLRRGALVEKSKRLAVNSKRWKKGGAEILTYREFRDLPDEGDIGFEKLQELNYINRVERSSPNRMSIGIEVRNPALLITTDVFYPGWQVKVDGQSKTPLQVNYLQRGVWLDKGQHTVEWVFRPPAVKWGFICVGLGLIGMIGLLVRPRQKTGMR